MDFLDPKKKRVHQQRLFIGYGLIAIALGIATTILVFAASGYGFNRKTGEIIQNGLLFVDSHPESTKVYLNGVDKGETDNRYVLVEGEYKIELKRSGYRTWSHNFTLEGGSVERFIYPFLFPTTLTSKDIQLYAAEPDLATTSPDRHWLVTHQASAFTSFDITDTSTKTNETVTIQVPAAVLPAKPNQKIKAVEWSTDNRHLLLLQTYDGGQDYVLLDREAPANSLNLTQVFGRSFTQMTLRDKQPDRFYGYDAATATLYSADSKTKALTPAITKLLAFWPYQNDTVLYVTADGAAAGKVIARMNQKDKTYTLRELPAGSKYLLNMAEFDGHLYVAAGVKEDGKVYVYRDPQSDLSKAGTTPLPRILLKVDSPDFISFSANARFIAVQGGARFAVYDAEDNRQIRYDTQLKLTNPAQQAEWMDGHRLSLVSDGSLTVFDFDGTNKQTLNVTSAAFAPMFDRDYTALFTISPSATVQGRSAIVRTELKLSNLNQ